MRRGAAAACHLAGWQGAVISGVVVAVEAVATAAGEAAGNKPATIDY